MVEDLQHMAVIADMDQELQRTVIEFNRRANGITDKMEITALRLEQIDRIREMLSKFERVLRWQRGEKVEPIAHSAEVVLEGKGMQAGI